MCRPVFMLGRRLQGHRRAAGISRPHGDIPAACGPGARAATARRLPSLETEDYNMKNGKR